MVLVIVIAVLAILVGYVRLAPSDPAVWHGIPEAEAELSSGVYRVMDGGPDGLARLADVALGTPRTTLLAGSVGTGMMTFVTRSRFWGFPDYTTVSQQGDQLKIFARQRFGRSDLGVNKDRIDRWIAAM